ncbi:aromatic acid exporter family protein [Nonomuraea longispora]|uniref:Aromatic acid exporter family protein n=1 Tax=Nonomuraea longispora TaxID=1848320 RepID=A0A4R4MZM9_9ACTN|nr:FUSC family protein [Nonomuraea longispora]TDB99836.1 aromatic acid exporter family protein [Nonomuraea longispora]
MRTKLSDHVKERLSTFGLMAPSIAQCALGAALAWLVAIEVLGHPRPIFAPISVLICVGVGLGQRLRRLIEMVVGVSLGVGVGDLLVSWIGSGAWQLALVVALAMAVAALLNSGALFVAQAGSSAVLVATLVPGDGVGGLDRMADALTGGIIGIAAVALLPASPFMIAAKHLSGVLDALSTMLEEAAAAIEKRDVDLAAEALEEARHTQGAVEEFEAALKTSKEIAMISPVHWHRRARLARYETAAVPVDLALRNARVLIRRTLASLGEVSPPPAALAEAMREVSEAALLLQLELGAGREPTLARQALLAVAARERPPQLGFSAHVIIAQLRSVVVDLLQATGMDNEEATAALTPLDEPSGGGPRGQ